MNIKAEFLTSCIVAGEPVHAGTKRELRSDIFVYLKAMGRVREAAPEPKKAETPEPPQAEIPQKKKGQK